MITLTESASFQIKEMIEEEGVSFLRFGITGWGCSGLSYRLGYEDKIEETDVVVESQGIKMVIDEKELPIVKNTVIDYKQSLMGGGFTIENPNAIVSCGCGSSFRTKEVLGNLCNSVLKYVKCNQSMKKIRGV